ELVDAELIGLRRLHSSGHARLPEIVRPRALRRRAETVAPMIPVRETTARPAQIGRAEPFHVIGELFADPANIGNLRVAAYPHAVVYHAAQVLDEMSI